MEALYKSYIADQSEYIARIFYKILKECYQEIGQNQSLGLLFQDSNSDPQKLASVFLGFLSELENMTYLNPLILKFASLILSPHIQKSEKYFPEVTNISVDEVLTKNERNNRTVNSSKTLSSETVIL